MGAYVRPELSEKNKYWISKHRHYELKHFCSQYPEWKKASLELEVPRLASSGCERIPSSNIPSDPTARQVLLRSKYLDKIEMVEYAAKKADRYLCDYILKGVTEGLSYTYLKTILKIPCSRDMYYDRYRKFFWVLSNVRN